MYIVPKYKLFFEDEELDQQKTLMQHQESKHDIKDGVSQLAIYLSPGQSKYLLAGTRR